MFYRKVKFLIKLTTSLIFKDSFWRSNYAQIKRMKVSVARNETKKKSPQAIKQELLASIIEILDKHDSLLNEEARNVKEPKEAISIIKKYERLLKEQHREIINILGKQVEFLKTFRERDEVFSRVGLSRSSIYFKIRLHKFLCKFPVLKQSTLTSSYCKSNFKSIKKNCRAKVDIIWRERVKRSLKLFVS